MTARHQEHPLDAFTLDDRQRGMPPGGPPISSRDIAAHGWGPADGVMALPLLSINLAVFAANRAAMMGVVRHFGIAIAPHAKTPMSPALARSLLDDGAWGTSVADLRQAAVMLRAGLRRIVIANQIGGASAARRLAQLLSGFPDAEVSVFVDSVPLASALHETWADRNDLPPLAMLLEVGRNRGGVRTEAEAAALVDALPPASARLHLAGVACYESSALRASEADTMAELRTLFGLAAAAMRLARAHAGPGRPLLLTAGSSSLFDLVIELGLPIVQADGGAMLLLRCGALFFGDHGNIQGRLDAVIARGRLEGALATGGRNPFGPAVRLWAEVLSHPEESLAICGLGLRDASHDQGLPVPLRLWRQGAPIAPLEGCASVDKLNDQHAFLSLAHGLDARVGDVVEFGIRHPCTCIDKHDVLYGLDGQGKVAAAFRTLFG